MYAKSSAELRLTSLASTLALLACTSSPPAQPVQAGSGGGAGMAASAGSSGAPAASAGSGGAASSGGSGGSSAVAGSAGTAGSVSATAWPQNAVAAVTLTYDDGLDTHLHVAAPQLDAQGFKGTFFISNFEGVDHDWALPNLTSPLGARHSAWQAMAENGHELAGHTVNHPCNSDGKAPNYKLTDYDMTRMGAELDDSVARLGRLGATAPLTFAYPCSSDVQGIGPSGDDYSALVAQKFLAARVSVSGVADPKSVDLHKVSQLDAGGKTGEELRAMVDQAVAQGGWLVVMFHGVGDEQSCGGLTYAPESCMINYLVTSSEAHASLVSYLAEKRSEVWTATFKQVAEHLAKAR